MGAVLARRNVRRSDTPPVRIILIREVTVLPTSRGSVVILTAKAACVDNDFLAVRTATLHFGRSASAARRMSCGDMSTAAKRSTAVRQPGRLKQGSITRLFALLGC